jgi:hypothetical protein
LSSLFTAATRFELSLFTTCIKEKSLLNVKVCIQFKTNLPPYTQAGLDLTTYKLRSDLGGQKIEIS